MSHLGVVLKASEDKVQFQREVSPEREDKRKTAKDKTLQFCWEQREESLAILLYFIRTDL